MKFLAVKDYEKFQHYRDRRPVWIKLYAELLDNWEFLQLSDAARGQLMLFWLLASRHDNRVPNDRRYIEGKLATRGRFMVKELLGSGFIIETDEPASKSASALLAEPEQNRSDPLGLTGAGRETEEETETTTTTTADGHADEFAEERHRQAYVGLRRAAQNPLGFDHEIRLLALGGERPGSGTQEPFGWAVVGEALHQLSVAGGQVRPRALLKFCEGVKNPPETEQRERRVAGAVAKAAIGDRGAPDAAEVLAALRSRIETVPVPGQGVNRVLTRERVEEMGPAVARAVEAVGGVRAVIDTPPDKFSFLVRDFGRELARAREATAA